VYSLFTDYECGAARKIPMTVHLNLDASGGVEQILVAATLLRGEPAAGRWAVAALGTFQLLAAAATRLPMGPARLVQGPGREVPAPASEARRPVAVRPGA
jgi:hypothetical protein